MAELLTVAEAEELPEGPVYFASLRGDMTTVKNWLAQGGDPNQILTRGILSPHDVDHVAHNAGTTLLMAAACMGRLDVVRLLVDDHGADVNIILTVTRERERVPWQVIETLESWTALAFAVSRCRADCVEFLLARGAEASGLVDGTRLICDDVVGFLDAPRVVRMLLVAGLNLSIVCYPGGSKLLEVFAREYAAFNENFAAQLERLGSGHANALQAITHYTESADILEGTRLAGHSYKRWVLKDYMALLRLRSLLARKRARAGPETTLVVWRLFDTSTAVGVPDPCFWLVVEYAWLGNWRRP